MIRRLRRRIKLGFCRSRLSDIEDTMASLQGKSSFPVWFVSLLVSVEHPADVNKQLDLLEAEREYYEKRVEILESHR
ncbi:hypothetical protein E6P09_09500 [Haloferax mediterranei ATCC 33500]|uniref:Uncharacterized protein n=2 Tax=Haloferax mediterranei TaxID=2252 RepID=M0J5E5_HALMT|nr:hypothetical protein [Haloferax mediterranei]AHZ21631.1 hypothetical protein BM92_02695 [Haloferax mediterranei ATCC 33500]EMA03548.1 hypothetical protein C439_04015 [Haloferax mediterranei ATCC 33500]QCQ75489.1 hypothetical protein E6P09_09500 [Haloferax mediterranei ATCC 33500]